MLAAGEVSRAQKEVVCLRLCHEGGGAGEKSVAVQFLFKFSGSRASCPAPSIRVPRLPATPSSITAPPQKSCFSARWRPSPRVIDHQRPDLRDLGTAHLGIVVAQSWPEIPESFLAAEVILFWWLPGDRSYRDNLRLALWPLVDMLNAPQDR
jgi:hypothetical protein